MESSVLVVSLDFELAWGLRGFANINGYLQNLLGVHQAIPAILGLFSKYGIHATWATVGIISCSNAEEALSKMEGINMEKDEHNNTLCDYLHGNEIAGKEPAHFAPELVERIIDADNQEIGTHTFSHYCCFEYGQSIRGFKLDLKRAIDTFQQKYGISLRSIVFPRGQYTQEHLEICSELGIIAYRGRDSCWWNAPQAWSQENLFSRSFRMADSYLNISGHHNSGHAQEQKEPPINIPASRMLRPSPSNKILEKLLIRRVKVEMRDAAKQKRLYHLWWHPHYFGAHLARNLGMLEDILMYYSQLRSDFGMVSMNVEEYASASFGEVMQDMEKAES